MPGRVRLRRARPVLSVDPPAANLFATPGGPVAMAFVVVWERPVVTVCPAMTLPGTSVVARELAAYVLLAKFVVLIAPAVTLITAKSVWAAGAWFVAAAPAKSVWTARAKYAAATLPRCAVMARANQSANR